MGMTITRALAKYDNYIKELLRELKREGKAVFLSSHHLLDTQEVCDDFCVLNQGRILVEGEASKLLSQDSSLENYFVNLIQKDHSPEG